MERLVSRAGRDAGRRARGGRCGARGPGLAAGRAVCGFGVCRRWPRDASPAEERILPPEGRSSGRSWRPGSLSQCPGKRMLPGDASPGLFRRGAGRGGALAAGGPSGQSGGLAYWPGLEGGRARSVVPCPKEGMAVLFWLRRGTQSCGGAAGFRAGPLRGSSLPPGIHGPLFPSSGPFVLRAIKDLP